MSSLPSFHEWLFLNVDWRVSSGTMKGKRYTFDAFPCVLPIVQDEHFRIAVMKSAQTAMSEQFTLQRPFYHMDVHSRNWAIMFPAKSDMTAFFRTRVKGAIGSNSYIRRKIGQQNTSNVEAFGRTLFLRYTTTESAIATFDAAGVTVDEQDLHNRDTLYGAKTSRTQGQMGDTFWYEISTPTYPKAGIHQSFLNSDQRVWMVKCTACGRENDLTQEVGPYDTRDVEQFFSEYLTELLEDTKMTWKDFHIPCSKCGKPIDPVTPLADADGGSGGRWVARFENRDIHGYHMQQFQRLYHGGPAMVLKRMRDNLMAANSPHLLRRWYNFTVGIPYSPSEGRLTDEDLELATVPPSDGELVNGPYRNVWRLPNTSVDWMGVDVRQGQYHVYGMSRQGNRKILSLIGWVKTSGEVRDLWERVGSPVFLQDAEPDTNDTRALVRAMGRRAKRGRFSRSLHALYNESAADKDLITIARPLVMEAVRSEVTGGEWVFPANAWNVGSGCFSTRGNEKYEEELSHHFKAPRMVRDKDEVTGNVIYDFPKDAMEGIDPHFYMAACLCYIAMETKGAPAKIITVPR